MESAADTVKLKLPCAAGVPEISPVDEFKDKPAGRPPLSSDQVTLPEAPVAVGVYEYATLTKPSSNWLGSVIASETMLIVQASEM